MATMRRSLRLNTHRHLRQVLFNRSIATIVQNQQTSTGTDALYNGNPQNAEGQAFNTPTGYSVRLTNCQFLLKKVGNPKGTANAKLYKNGTGVNLPSPLLATSDGLNVSTLPTSLTWVTFKFSGTNQYIMSPGTQYTIMLFVPASGSDASDYVAISYSGRLAGLGYMWQYGFNGPTAWDYITNLCSDFIVSGGTRF